MQALQALLSAGGEEAPQPAAAKAAAPSPAAEDPEQPGGELIVTKPSKALSQSFGRGIGFDAKSGAAAPTADPLAASMAMAEALEVGLPPQASSAPSSAADARAGTKRPAGVVARGLFGCCGKGSMDEHGPKTVPPKARPANVVQI